MTANQRDETNQKGPIRVKGVRPLQRFAMGQSTVFLSYAREDVDAARRLYDILMEAGIDVWFDRVSLRPGEQWKTAISKAIRNSRYFVALLSSTSTTKRGYVQKEIREALNVLDEYPEEEIYVVPVRLDECMPTHKRLADLNWVDLFPSWEQGQSKLLRFFGAEPANQAVTEGEQVRYAPTVRLDGVYATATQESNLTRYLRFYGDGTVIAASIGTTENKVFPWFTKEWAEENDRSRGTFSISGPNIQFATQSSYGRVDYQGTIRGSTLVVEWHSHINGNRGIDEYHFVSERTGE
jgi:hypothetical protein